MPDVDGYEFLQKLRRSGGHDLPVIALTAFARSEDRARALKEGFAAHLAKPVEPWELMMTIVTVTGQSGC